MGILLILSGIFVKNNTPVVSSRVIAERFGKEHKTILRSIDNLECSEEFNRHNFVPISYSDSMNRLQREYLLTKDGFAFLVMGFTGKEAAAFKEKYIAAFNYMAEALQTRKNMKKRENNQKLITVQNRTNSKPRHSTIYTSLMQSP